MEIDGKEKHDPLLTATSAAQQDALTADPQTAARRLLLVPRADEIRQQCVRGRGATLHSAAGELDRQLSIGAEVMSQGGVHFRLWAPQRCRVEVVIAGAPHGFALQAEAGYFSGLIETAAAGTLYRFRLDGNEHLYPDPASRFQPEGPHGPSQVIDPNSFTWTDTAWQGVHATGQVIYEMHIGTFTPAGTWAAAINELEALADLGITLLEVMPVADFTGRFGWGYDGVDLFAPTRLYGQPDDFRRFVDRAHALGLGVILDGSITISALMGIT